MANAASSVTIHAPEGHLAPPTRASPASWRGMTP